MYEDIIELAQNQQYIQAVQGQLLNSEKAFLKNLPRFEELKEFEERLEQKGDLEFSKVFREPLGFYLIKQFLIAEHSVDKAIFLSDVDLYKSLSDPSARYRVANKIYDHFCASEKANHIHGLSVFESDTENTGVPRSYSVAPTVEGYRLSLCTEGTNSIGVYGRVLKICKSAIDRGDPPISVFDAISEEVWTDLRLDVYPRFCKSSLYKMYIRCKSLEDRGITVRDFQTLRVLGRGAFGAVHACIKKDTGKLYAMKKINKRRVQATESVDTIMAERNFLADMEGNFVTGLKYAVQDEDSLYLILDLMVGGDLKFHLNRETSFKEDRARFYAAEVLLGLEHIHSKNIVYRDLKLENILMDEKGHCKLSDLGLAVRNNNNRKVRGYAGTPGYTGPEVVLNKPYDHMADFFSLGVLIYRFLSGKKPFARKRSSDRGGRNGGGRDRNARRKSSDLDRNVVEIEPEYPSSYFTSAARSLCKGLMAKNPKNRLGFNGISEVKNHPWFDEIDFGLLEAGYLSPPFIPRVDEINADSQNSIGAPPQDQEYHRVKLREDFEESLRSFHYVSKPSLQKEIVDVLQALAQHNMNNAHNNGHGSTHAGTHGAGGFTNKHAPFDPDFESDPRDASCFQGCSIM